jgi:hypothetical protein
MSSRWRRAEILGTPSGYEDFLTRYPEGVFSDSARLRIEQLNFAAAESANSIETYRRFLDKYPAGKSTDRVEQAIEKLRWAEATKLNTPEAYQTFLREYPSGNYSGQARSGIELLAWQHASSTNTREAYQTLLNDYPEGTYAANAKHGIENLEWEAARSLNSVGACDEFLKKHPAGECASEALSFKENLIAEQRRGTLIGLYPNAKGLPPDCSLSRVVSDSSKSVLATIEGNVFVKFPGLADKYATELERQSFMTTPQGDSLRRVLVAQKTALCGSTCAISLGGFQGGFHSFPTYDVDAGSFVVTIDGCNSELPYASNYLSEWEHVIRGFWFDLSSLRSEFRSSVFGLSVYQLLTIGIQNKGLALDIERRRGNLEMWLCFHLTGRTRQIEQYNPVWHSNYVTTHPEARDVVILLIDKATGDVVWSGH